MPHPSILRDRAHTVTPAGTSEHIADAATARRIVLAGRVQGLGVRPTIARVANALGLAGRVRNTTLGVDIEIEGPGQAVTRFVPALHDELPAACIVDRLDDKPGTSRGAVGFEIVTEPATGPLATQVPPDLAVCNGCLMEIRDPSNRRFRYPFTSCTLCGPRYSIIGQMPYERVDTAMRHFDQCPECWHEYRDPNDRRFHSQTNACPQCGPRVWWTCNSDVVRVSDDRAVERAVDTLRHGGIVAVKGVGGYQLLVDATNGQAIERLRQRKRRPDKPLAVLVASLDAANSLAHLDSVERQALTAAANPIVLVRRRDDVRLADGIAPELNTIGLLLPTTPLHDLLVRDVGRPLICTSGNLNSLPLEFRILEAERNLANICDGWLHHDRPIVNPIDDSVVRVVAGKAVTLRLARGLAPLPLRIDSSRPALAVGGHLKCAQAWSTSKQSVLGPHVGEQDSLAARKRLQRHSEQMANVYRYKPRRITHDVHPDYSTTIWATQQTVPTQAIQHHHAHVVAAMVEFGWLDRQVLGVAWDGSGWGPDGTVWGGEFLLASATEFTRVARIRPFALPGGDTAVYQPWRTLLSIAAQIGRVQSLRELQLLPSAPELVDGVLAVLENPDLSPQTSSAGRLFDAAATVILGTNTVSFEGQAAMRLESIADVSAEGFYPMAICDREPIELDWRPLFAQLLSDRLSGVAASTLSTRFHRSLALAICQLCARFAALPVVLTGGVFQNRLLTELVVEHWSHRQQPLATPGIIPPGDGGLAAGQLAAGASG